MNKISNVSKGEKVALFNNIGIETSSKCNRHCYFCPNDYFKRPDELMPMETIYKIVNELVALKYKGRVELYIYNEPTRDKRLIDIIHCIRTRLPSVCIMINTNGDYFKSHEDIQKFFDAGLNQMQINIYSAADKSLTGTVFENGVKKAEERMAIMQQWVDKTGVRQDLSLYQNIGAKKRSIKVIKKFGIQRTATSKDVEGVNHFSNRSGNVPGFHDATKEPIKKYCTRPFRFLNINWNGDSLLCCNDFYGKTNFGNVNQSSLEEIWNNYWFNVYRLRLQNSNRDMFLCDKCDFQGGYYPHMINKVTFGKQKDKELMNSGNIQWKQS